MSTNVTAEDVERIERRLASAKETKARLEGAQASEMEAWKRQWGISSLEELEASIADLREKTTILQEKANEKYQAILNLMPADA